MSRTVKHPNAHSRVRCGLCHPDKKWKHQMSRLARLPIRDQRRLGAKPTYR